MQLAVGGGRVVVPGIVKDNRMQGQIPPGTLAEGMAFFILVCTFISAFSPMVTFYIGLRKLMQ